MLHKGKGHREISRSHGKEKAEGNSGCFSEPSSGGGTGHPKSAAEANGERLELAEQSKQPPEMPQARETSESPTGSQSPDSSPSWPALGYGLVSGSQATQNTIRGLPMCTTVYNFQSSYPYPL